MDIVVRKAICAALLCLWSACLSYGCGGGSPTSPAGSGPAVLLSANVVDPLSSNAVSLFNACVGHAFPLSTSPNSAKNYFWPNSTNFSSNDRLPLYAACSGITGQNNSDTNDPTSTRGLMIHLWCDNSSTGLRYFHINMVSGVLGRHVNAGDLLGYASLLAPGQTASQAWQYSSSFDIAVFDGDDSATINYFAKLSTSAFGAWASRGVTSVGQTASSSATTCPSFNADVGQPGILSFTPQR